MQRRHTRLVPHVRCIVQIEQDNGEMAKCGKSMYYLHAKDNQSIYGCTMGHIRKLERVTVQSAPPQDAA